MTAKAAPVAPGDWPFARVLIASHDQELIHESGMPVFRLEDGQLTGPGVRAGEAA